VCLRLVLKSTLDALVWSYCSYLDMYVSAFAECGHGWWMLLLLYGESLFSGLCWCISMVDVVTALWWRICCEVSFAFCLSSNGHSWTVPVYGTYLLVFLCAVVVVVLVVVKCINKKPSCHKDSQPYWLSVTFKIIKGRCFYVILNPVCDFLSMVNSNLGPILHHLATIYPWQTNRRMADDNHDKGPTLSLQLSGWPNKWHNSDIIFIKLTSCTLN